MDTEYLGASLLATIESMMHAFELSAGCRPDMERLAAMSVPEFLANLANHNVRFVHHGTQQ